MADRDGSGGFLATFAEPGRSLQAPFDAAIVMPSVLRPQIVEALQSIFAQAFNGRIQVLVGIDVRLGDLSMVEAACRSRPPQCVVQVFDPGYSTSIRHGGLHPARDGGVLRTILSLLANAPLVAYLDDDNWWHPAHLATLREAIAGHDYAYSLRWFVHPVSKRVVCRDDWESVGPNKGWFINPFGGFIDPNCLMLDKRRCGAVLPLWLQPLSNDPKGMSADRNVFAALRSHYRGAATGQATAYYRMDPQDGMHPIRMKVMAAQYQAAAD